MFKIKLLLSYALLFVLVSTINAQTIKTPKMDLPEMDLSSQVLGILNDTKGLDLNSDQKDKLSQNNSSFVDNLMKLKSSEASEEDKKAGFLKMKNNRAKLQTSLFGNDLFKKYSKQVLKSISPFKSKLGLAALAF